MELIYKSKMYENNFTKMKRGEMRYAVMKFLHCT